MMMIFWHFVDVVNKQNYAIIIVSERSRGQTTLVATELYIMQSKTNYTLEYR